MKRLAALSMLLVMLCSAFMVGTAASAAEPGTADPDQLGEVLELREKNSETYRLEDGSYECVVFAEDKYFEDETGELIEISNTVVPEKHIIAGKEYGFTNEANSNRIYFSESDPSVLVSTGKQDLAFSIVTDCAATPVIGGLKDVGEIAEYSLSGDTCFAYMNAFEHTDLVYKVRNGMLKEYIVLNDVAAPREFTFIFDTANYAVAYTEYGTVGFYDGDGELVFELGDLFAVDAADAYTDELTYTLGETVDGKTDITVTLSEDYANNPERVYPVLVDPSIMVTGTYETQDSFVSSLNPTTNYYSKKYIRMGWDSNYYVRRTYIRFNIPDSVYGHTITESYMSLKKHDCGNDPQLKAYRVMGSWASNTITWNNKPSYSSTYSSATASQMTNNWFRFYVTNIVQKWSDGTYQNYGFMVKNDNESGTGNWSTFYSSDADSPNKPELRIIYEPTEEEISTVYINNLYWGKYLHRSTNGTINATSGLISSLGDSIRWKATYCVNGQYTLQPLGDLSKYLFESSSESVCLKTPSNPSAMSNCYYWTITAESSGNRLIRNVSTGNYLIETSATAISSTDSIGAVGSSTYKKSSWRVVTTNYYGNTSSSTKREFSANSSISNIEVAKGSTITTIPVNKYYSNEIWCSFEDFTFSIEDTSIAHVDSNGAIKTNNVLGGTRVTATHKVTNRVNTFAIIVGFSSSITSTPLAGTIISGLNQPYDVWPASEESEFYNQPDVIREACLDGYWLTAKTMALGGDGLGYVNASDFLIHYLENSGELYSVNFKNVISSWTTAYNFRTNDLNELISAVEVSASGTNKTIRLMESIPHNVSESTDWGRAIGSYYCSITCTYRKTGQTYIASVVYELHDVYDWDRTITSMGNLPISPSQLWELHHGGYAKNFEVFGSNTFTMTWTAGQSMENGVVISNEN